MNSFALAGYLKQVRLLREDMDGADLFVLSVARAGGVRTRPGRSMVTLVLSDSLGSSCSAMLSPRRGGVLTITKAFIAQS